jgi:serine/threonine-protein kinase
VTGQSQASATSQLSNDGFKIASTTQVSTTATPGDVISQNPSGGASVAPGTTVTIVVAKPQPKVNVPDVKGQKAGPARSTLSGAGFKVATQQQDTTDPAQKGIVLDEIPPGGSSQTQGSTVTIVVGHFTGTSTTSASTTSTTPTTKTSTTK